MDESGASGGSRKGNLVLAVNGQSFELSEVDHPSTTLLDFLRLNTPFKSVKLGCGEGGCGACVVLLSRYDAKLDRVEDYSVNSCLTLLGSVNGCSVTTTEGLGNSRDGFHPIHQRFSGFHASQCGFCTPGMCMSFYSSLVNAEKAERPEPPQGFSKLTASEAERAVAGNLCRCTGYRPIADACKSFAADVDMEDLGLNSFWKKSDGSEEKIGKMPPFRRSNGMSMFPEFLKERMKSSKVMDEKRFSWYTPVTIREVQSLLEDSVNDKEAIPKLVLGNTGAGYYKDMRTTEKYIDLRYVSALSLIRKDEKGIEIGAAVSISKAIEALREESAGKSKELVVTFGKIADHLEKVASRFVRNAASIGGNIVMAQRLGFPSDIVTVLLAADSGVTILSKTRQESVSLERFLGMDPLDSRSILVNVTIPFPEISRNLEPKARDILLFDTYRAAPRPLGNALPYLNAAFMADVSSSETLNGVVIKRCRLAFGAYGTKHSIRARKVEETMTGKVLSPSLLMKAMEAVRMTIIPADGTAHHEYRISLAVSYLFKFFGRLLDFPDQVPNVCLDGQVCFSSEDTDGENGFQRQNPALLSSSRQIVEVNNEHFPVGKPIKKSEAAIQASGEAVYVDDIPAPPSCLYGAFVYSTKPLARIKGIMLSSNIASSSVTALITFKDIPKGGENIGSLTIFGQETLFADELTRFAGERVAFVVADSQKHANMAAESSVIDYDTDNLDPPILTVEEAVEKSSFFDVPPYLQPEEVGDVSKGMEEAEHMILSAKIGLGSQYYFYIENQTALAVPDEDNCMVVYSSSQCPEYAHDTIAKCLGVRGHNVRVISRRVGGGFGGKSLRAIPVSAACALAAHTLRRPVRTYLSRKTDMIMAGGRHPMKVTYSVGFKTGGKITALRIEVLINAGISPDVSAIIPQNFIATLKKYDWGALSFDINVCKTNHTSKSAMRAPGEVQGTYIAESIIEHVASVLSLDADDVRKANLHTVTSLGLFYKDSVGDPDEYTIPSIWDKLGSTADFLRRTEMIEEFNRVNIWRKRGISRVPIVHEVSLRATPGKVSILRDGSIIVEVGGIEIGQGLWTKVKQMVAFALSSLVCDGNSSSLLEKIRVVQADSLSLIQGGFTAGSTTSEASCQAVRMSCDLLVGRLSPLKDKLKEHHGSVNWESLILQAHMQSTNMSASSFYIPEFGAIRYLNYGAAASEVEIDVLTGETTILRTDIVYDCGKSLNPAVDLGQIEGAFVQGIGFFMLEEYLTNEEGLTITEGTWTYKIPTLDTIPKQFNVEITNTGSHRHRVLSSKGSGSTFVNSQSFPLGEVSVRLLTFLPVRDSFRGAAAAPGGVSALRDEDGNKGGEEAGGGVEGGGKERGGVRGGGAGDDAGGEGGMRDGWGGGLPEAQSHEENIIKEHGTQR
ncbi:hypothetical protein MLD38_008192 [Melastoma candidum]|uniref:Uncharacterized protein n=1 Tax=Melastoma candidum TaxID=119954 RepID=A0ACB9RT81_9MYRT|nr:hypothetical protein MLD38_008192 [Melastoma candidum]